MNRSRLRDFIIRTVWPYLGLRSADAVDSAEASEGTASPLSTTRTTQQVLFTSPAVGVAYVGRLDVVVNSLGDAALLYRARGGEILRSFVLSKLAADDSTWTVEIIISVDGIRGTIFSFSPPLTLTVNEATNVAEVFPNLELPANCGVYARITDGPAPAEGLSVRIDGILEIERDATL